jgi:hypothetical protein
VNALDSEILLVAKDGQCNPLAGMATNRYKGVWQTRDVLHPPVIGFVRSGNSLRDLPIKTSTVALSFPERRGQCWVVPPLAGEVGVAGAGAEVSRSFGIWHVVT